LPTGLYRLFDRDGEPVYFGIGVDPVQRMKAHRRRSWWPEVDESRTLVEWFDNREAAEAAELAAIRAERPRHNIVTSDEHGCARFLPRQDGRPWGKSPWEPKTKEQFAAIAALRRSVAKAKRLNEKADADEAEVWRLAAAARVVGVAATFITKRIGPNRATLYRRVPAKAKRRKADPAMSSYPEHTAGLSDTADNITAEIVEGILVHHASGHFTRDEARARLRVAGFSAMSEAAADQLLDRPVDPTLFDAYRTWPPRQGRAGK
jgi:hypothetical protein